MSSIQARKNIETDNPRHKSGAILCRVLVSHVKAEFAGEYEENPNKRMLIEHVRRADSFTMYPIEFEEAYDLYLMGYVVPADDAKDPRPRAALLPYLTPRQKEAQAYLNGEHRTPGGAPDFVKEEARREADRRTSANRAEIKSKALRGE